MLISSFTTSLRLSKLRFTMKSSIATATRGGLSKRRRISTTIGVCSCQRRFNWETNGVANNKIVKIVAALAVGTVALVFLSPLLFPVSQPNNSVPTINRKARKSSASIIVATKSATSAPVAAVVKTAPASPNVDETDATNLVGSAIVADNKLGIASVDLIAKSNPKGAGTFVYVQQTRFSGVERDLIWMVIEGKAYALNSPSKMVTPDLSWPREAEDETWAQTKIDKFSGADEAIKLIR